MNKNNVSNSFSSFSKQQALANSPSLIQSTKPRTFRSLSHQSGIMASKIDSEFENESGLFEIVTPTPLGNNNNNESYKSILIDRSLSLGHDSVSKGFEALDLNKFESKFPRKNNYDDCGFGDELDDLVPAFNGVFSGFDDKLQSIKNYDVLPMDCFADKDKFSNLFAKIDIPPSKVKGYNNINNNEEKEDIMFGEPQLTPDYYNEFTSCTTDSKANIVLLKLLDLCNEYAGGCGVDGGIIINKIDNFEKEIEYSVDYQCYEINGLLYLKHKPIHFIISIWIENNKQTRIEFRKMRGDSLLFQHFWSDMLELIYKHFENVGNAQRCNDFESLFMPSFDLEFPLTSSEDDDISDGLESLDINVTSSNDDSSSDNDDVNRLFNNKSNYYTNSDLDYYSTILKNDYRDDAIDTLAMICTELGSKKDKLMKFYDLVSKHDKLILTIMNHVITHSDPSHIRGGLCVLNVILSKINNDNSNNSADVLKSKKMFEKCSKKSSLLSILQRLVNHKSKVVREHAMLCKNVLGLLQIA